MIMKASISIVEADDTKQGFDNIIIAVMQNQIMNLPPKSPGTFSLNLKILETLIVSNSYNFFFELRFLKFLVSKCLILK